MDIQFYGANALVLSTKGIRLVVDDNLSDMGSKSVTKPGDIVLFTGAHGSPAVETRLVVNGPGEYEASGLSITGIAARGHMDASGTKQMTMYKILHDNTSYLIVGHVYPELSEAQLELLNMVDVLIVPVGGNGYTLDPIGALKLIKNIEPKIVIPTHYDDSALAYPVPQQPLEQVLKNIGMEPKLTTTKYHYKPQDISDSAQLVILERS